MAPVSPARTLRLGVCITGALLLGLLAELGGAGITATSSASEPTCAPRQSAYSGGISSTPGLVGYWRLGESSGTVACDSTGQDNGAYLGGFTLGVPGAIPGDPDTAVSVNGSSGQMSVPSSAALNVGDSFTIEAWVKRGDSKTGSNETIASKQDGAWVLMFNESDRLTLRRSTVGNVAAATVPTTDTTAWHYVAATKNGASVHLYLDGVDVTGTVTNQTMENNSQPLVIGQSTGTAYLKGAVDEAALYKTPLTPTQIAQHYKAELAGQPAPPGALSATPGNGTVKLGWTASPTTGVTGYDVYRANADGTWPSTPLAAVSSSTLSYTDSGLTNATTYTYRVTAFNSAGVQSSPSNQVSATPTSTCAPRQSAYSGGISSTPGLVGYWRLGESSGTVACDSTGQDNGAYLGGFTLGVPGAIPGDPDTAVSVNGSSGQMSVPSSAALNVGDSFTIEAWVKRGDSKTGSNETIASKQDGAWVLMFNESDRLTLRRSTVGNVAAATVPTTDTTAWHYVAATKNGASVHLYLDGVDVTGTVTNQTMENNSQPLVIGQSTGTAYLKGAVDEAALYKTPLTPTQIAQHYGAGAGSGNGEPISGTDPVLAADGDIACPYGDTADECEQGATANLTAAQHPNAVAVLGDNQYQSGLLSEYNSLGAYNNTWGKFNSIVHPTPGNHEYAASTSAGGYFTYFGAAAGNGNYSYDLGSWHIVALNSDCSNTGCKDSIAGATSSSEVSWLQSDLAAHPNQCVLAYWHHPAFSSGWVGNSPGVIPFWKALYAAHADVVLNGHDHMYERFAQQDPSQKATSQGIREFVVGTGGETLFSMGKTQPNMQAVDNHHFGALFLTLHAGSYDWAFRTISGTLIDSGSTACHAQPSGTTGAATAKLAGVATIRSAAWTMRFSQTHASSFAALSAAMLSAVASRVPASLRFAARPLRSSLAATSKPGLPIRVHCSRACDLGVTIGVRRGAHTITVARFRETETEISKPFASLVLHLRQSRLLHLRARRLILTFVATDASGEQRRSTSTVVFRRRR